MKFKIENIGPICSAEIDVDGITIIAGENNRGKSTVGKVIYAVLHDMYRWDEKYEKEISERYFELLAECSIELETWCLMTTGRKRAVRVKTTSLQRRYATSEKLHLAIEDFQIHNGIDDGEQLRAIFREYCNQFIALYYGNQIVDSSEIVEKVINRMIESAENIQTDEVFVQMNSISTQLDKVFQKQYRRINTKQSKIEILDDYSRNTTLSFRDNTQIMNQAILTYKQVYIIETSEIIDLMNEKPAEASPKLYLQFLMRPNVHSTKVKYTVTEQDSYDNYDSSIDYIKGALSETIGGGIEYHKKDGVKFKEKETGNSILLANLSKGVKSLSLIEYALRLKAFKDGDIIILDEPEINLHPEWQIVFAETIVQLVKKKGLNFVITSHSPYFIRAIECYSDIMGIMDKLNVYRAKFNRNGDEEENGVKMMNVSYSEYGMSELYEDMSSKLEQLNEIIMKRDQNDQ